MLAGAALASATALHSSAARAFGDAPWCAVIEIGAGEIYWNCQYRTIEDCVPDVIAGNRGFCNINPGFVPPVWATPTRHRKRHS